MKRYSETAWNIASNYSHTLASETRDLAGWIDAAMCGDLCRQGIATDTNEGLRRKEAMARRMLSAWMETTQEIVGGLHKRGLPVSQIAFVDVDMAAPACDRPDTTDEKGS